MPLSALGIVVGPALQGMMADRVGDDAQGELQGVLSSVVAVGVILSPLLMTGIFRFFTSAAAPVYLPGAPFVVAGLMTALALVLLHRVPRQR
jgi:DHA1 family tetracycline resistance protein-like MFS transporter